MCCLFGMIDCYGRFSAREKAHILSVLATECEERGTDATGIAYCTHDHLSIYKRPLEAHKLHCRIPEDSRVIMGHTRMTTQGKDSYSLCAGNRMRRAGNRCHRNRLLYS